MKKFLAVLALLFLLLAAAPANAGEYEFKIGFFPDVHDPKDPWEMQLVIRFEAQGWRDRLKDLKEKDVAIVVWSKDKEKLYTEDLKITASDPEAVIEWQSRESVSVVVKDRSGTVQLERKLVWDAEKKQFKKSPERK